MKVTITARHAHITDAMRNYARKKADWLGGRFEFVGDLSITLNVEAKRHTAEIIALTRKAEKLVASAATDDMYLTLDTVTDKMARQLHKLKDRIKAHRAQDPGREPSC